MFKIPLLYQNHIYALIFIYYIQFKTYLIIEKIFMPLTKQRAEERRKVIIPNSISYNFHILVQPGTHYSGIS